LDVGDGTAWDVKIDQINQVVWACGVNDSSKPWIAKSKDKGDSWEFISLELDQKDSVCYQIAIHPNNPDIIYFAAGESVIETRDGGKTWRYTGLRGRMVHFHDLVIDPFNPDHLWAAGEINENYLALWTTPFILYESFDGGVTWRFVPSILLQMPDQIITAIVADPNQQNVLYIATKDNGVWRYKSQQSSLAAYFPLQTGNWWTFSNSYTEKIIDTVRIVDDLYFRFDQFRHFPNGLLRMTSDNKLLLRDNTTEQVWLDFSAKIGESWQVKASDGRSEWTVHLQSKTDTVIVPAGTFTDCYRFWFQFAGADNDWVEWYAPSVGPVKRILYGFAVIEYPLISAFVNGFYLPTKINESQVSSNPEQFHLYPNYPNPFNTSTVIRYDISELSFVSLEIYNLLGHRVKILVHSVQIPGQYQFFWDGRNEGGDLIPTGIYLCRLQAGSQKSVKKIAFIK
jgi:hypothetical protein